MATTGFTPQRLNDLTEKGQLYPLYLLYGDESFLMDESLSLIEKSALAIDGVRDFNFNIFYGGDADISRVRDAVETLPMMSQVRVVVVKDAHELVDKDWDLLMPLIENPVPSTVFVLVASKIDKRKKSIKRVLENGCTVEFKRPYDEQIPGWIDSIARKKGLRLTSEIIDLFHQLVGSNLQDVSAELEKLQSYLGEKKQPSTEDVLKVVSRVRLDSVFDLTDAIGKNDRARSLGCLVNLLDNGQNEIGVLALISRHVRILKLITEGQRDGLTGQKLSARAGVSPYFLKSYIDQANSWNDKKIERTFQALLDTDRALKSSPVASHIWLENFIVQTCS